MVVTSKPASTGVAPIVASSSSGHAGAPARLGRPNRVGSQPSRHTMSTLRLPQSMCAFMMPSMLTMPVPRPNSRKPAGRITACATASSERGPARRASGSPAATRVTAT